jgi:uncharacterized membrane protein
MKHKKSMKHLLGTGLLSIVPIAVTYWIIEKLFNFFAKPGASIVNVFFGDKTYPYIPEFVGFILTLIFIIFVGLIISNVIGKQLYNWMENVLSRIPIVNSVYKTIKGITVSISDNNKQAFKKVVFIEYPRKGLWSLAMVTGESKNTKGEEYYHVVVVTTPNPTSGYLLYILKSDTIETKMSVEEGLKIIISGGLLAPDSNEI